MAWATYKETLADVGWATEGEPPAYVGQAPKWFTHVHTEIFTSAELQNKSGKNRTTNSNYDIHSLMYWEI